MLMPMLLDINAPEFLILLVIAIVLFGPEKLPELFRKGPGWSSTYGRWPARRRSS